MIRDPFQRNNPPMDQGPNHTPDAPTEPFTINNSPLGPRVSPEQLMHKERNLPPGPPHKKFAHLWRTDPAYRVLFIAVGVILASFLVCGILLGSFFFVSGKSTQQAQTPQTTDTPENVKGTANANSTATATAKAQPTATATTAPAQTPGASPTVAATAPAATQPTQAPAQFTVTITSIPSVVANNSTVTVVVNTSHPNSSTSLVITSNGIPPYTQLGPQITDANGNTTFYWQVHESSFGTKSVTANVVAVAQDNQGQQARSQPATVQIMM